MLVISVEVTLSIFSLLTRCLLFPFFSQCLSVFHEEILRVSDQNFFVVGTYEEDTVFYQPQ